MLLKYYQWKLREGGKEEGRKGGRQAILSVKSDAIADRPNGRRHLDQSNRCLATMTSFRYCLPIKSSGYHDILPVFFDQSNLAINDMLRVLKSPRARYAPTAPTDINHHPITTQELSQERPSRDHPHEQAELAKMALLA